MTKDGSTINYKYDDSGIRQSKTVNGVTTHFTTIGGKITSQNDGTDSLYFRYDKDDSLIGVQVNGAEYLYIKNLQGDIISVIDYDGIVVVNYTYDSFGKVVSMTGSLADTIGQLNPMRYRGYYYDSETGLYYLQSRYYDAEMQRFINADDVSVLGLTGGQVLGANLFAYCNNNLVNYSDSTGHWGLPLWAKIAIGIAGIAVAAALTVASGGAALPALIATLKFVAGSMAVGMVIGGLIGYLTGGISGLKTGLLNGAADGFMWGGIGAAVSAAFKAIQVFKAGKAVSPKCFVAGTLIAAKDGYVPIEEVKQGDLVYSENPETGEKALKSVIQTFVRKTDQFVHVKVDGQNITTTTEHPFCVLRKGWTNAVELRAGDILVLQNGNQVVVKNIQYELLESPATVYNFEVEDFHTYYVTDSAILVHNECGFGNFRTLQETAIKGYKVSMDLERGGSGLLNIHLKIGGTKYFRNGKTS